MWIFLSLEFCRLFNPPRLLKFCNVTLICSIFIHCVWYLLYSLKIETFVFYFWKIGGNNFICDYHFSVFSLSLWNSYYLDARILRLVFLNFLYLQFSYLFGFLFYFLGDLLLNFLFLLFFICKNSILASECFFFTLLFPPLDLVSYFC